MVLLQIVTEKWKGVGYKRYWQVTVIKKMITKII